MQTLPKSIGKEEAGGEPIPVVFQTFAKNKINFRRGDLSMIAGVPGAGKSTLALAIALRAQVPTLYICADTNAYTMGMRLYSMITGKSQEEAEWQIANNLEDARKVLGRTDHIFWAFDAAPSLNDIDMEIKAFVEVWGESPALIIIDNLMDVSTDSQDISSLKFLMQEFKYLAGSKNSAVLVLHHTKESSEGNPCQPMRAVQGMVNQLPALILTVATTPNNMMAVAPVKNRSGQHDKEGNLFHWLQFNGEYMFIADPEVR